MIGGIGPVDGLGAMLGHDFIRNAFVAGTLVALAGGLVGYFVVLRNQVFSGDALSHVAVSGSLAALAIGVDPLVGLFGSTIAGAVGMGGLGGRLRGRDVAVGTVLTWILGIGVLCLSVYTTQRSSANGAAGVGVLFGSIYGLSLRQALVAAAVGAGVALAIAAIARPLLFASVDSDVAAARGIPVGPIGLGFLALVGVTVAEAVQAVGALLVVGLMVTPAAAAHRLTARPYAALGLSGGLSVACLWAGLTLSYAYQRIPPSFFVISLAFAVYACVVAWQAAVGRTAVREWYPLQDSNLRPSD